MLFAAFVLGGAEFSPRLAPAGQAGAPQPGAPAAETSSEVIKTESQLVLVDVIVTDKKDHHLGDLTAKDFRVYEDDKEQPIASFSHIATTPEASSPSGRRYIVLFFDDSSMNTADQAYARKAAAEFVAKSTSKEREMAVVDFAGTTRIAQDFTSDPAALKSAVEGVKFGTLRPNEPGQSTELASLGGPKGVQIRSDFAARSILLAVRSMCRSLRPVPGRKTLILFSGGFPLNSERETELSATIDAANKANVAIYPIDVRGLQGLQAPEIMNNPMGNPMRPGGPPGADLGDSPFLQAPVLLASLDGWIPLHNRLEQRPGGGGGGGDVGGAGGGGGGGGGGGPRGGGGGSVGGGGGTRGGGTGGTGATGGNPAGPGGNTPGNSGGGSRGNTGGYLNNFGQPNMRNNPMNQIIPPLMENVSTNQQVLYELANGTGGFVIVNTNDFKAGLEKIAADMDDYYILGYVPPHPDHDGSYHRIKVKSERHGVEIRARNGYFDTKSPDLLAGKPEGKVLEEHAASSAPSDFPVAVAAPHFYTSPGVARVNLALQMPSNSIDFQKQKGKYHSEINVLGIAYRPDGSVAARFSDTVKDDVEKKDMKELLKSPFTYQNTFDIAPGRYNLKIVLSSGGEKFGKFETPLSVGEFTGKKFGMSGVALSREVRRTTDMLASLDTQLLEERTPLIFRGMEVVPTADYNFSKQEKIAVYCEVYEPGHIIRGLGHVGLIVDIFDRKTNERAFTTNTMLIDENMVEGNPLIPVLFWLPDETLQPGEYRMEIHALDSLSNTSPVHSLNFVLQ